MAISIASSRAGGWSVRPGAISSCCGSWGASCPITSLPRRRPGTIADFRKDNGPALRQVCARFIELCRKMGLLATASVAIDGSKFKAVNNRDKNFTRGKVERRRAQLEESVARYLSQLDTADRQAPTEALSSKTKHLKEKLVKLKSAMDKLSAYARQNRSADLAQRTPQPLHGHAR